MIVKRFVLVTLVIIFSVSCNTHKQHNNAKGNPKKTNHRVSVIKVNSPKSGRLFTVGDLIPIEMELKKKDIQLDSLVFESNKKKSVVYPNELKYSWQTQDLNVGNNLLTIKAYSKGNVIDNYYLKLRFKSDIVPEKYRCVIKKTYPHNKDDYTQGLIYENGILYEGTGRRGKSVLKKIDFKTGKLIAELALPQSYFGEGVTIFGDKIIQLTWQSRKGFVYDKNNFKLINTIGYNTQGWGLTNDGEKLIMSDGSQTIHLLDSEYFTEISKIDIYDNNGAVRYLNELEYIDGLVYANVYQKNIIVAFDIKTGKVVKQIDCNNLVPKAYVGNTDYVFNGIAYDKENNRIFVTGKCWPYLYEVEFVK
ncbi:MAG: glutaminyl-peptide cyclotransferase [Bacteroidales bacterium]|nr:glutaminyl-peptide cyclotransferase [Bacteroidales bacterium]